MRRRDRVAVRSPTRKEAKHVTSPGSTASWGEAAVRAKARVPSRAAGATQPATGEPAARLRVLYADTDAGGVVYHGSYLRFFEAGRTEAMRSAGVPWRDLLNTSSTCH
jgi:hypothetical protein